jgi:hypothetical protein
LKLEEICFLGGNFGGKVLGAKNFLQNLGISSDL